MHVGGTVFCVTDDEYHRLWSLCVQRLRNAIDATREPWKIAVATAECERVYVEAIRNHNVNVAATAAIVLADVIHVCRLEGWDVVDLEELDESLVRSVRARLVRNQMTVTVEEAAAILGCTPQHIRRLARAGRITGRRTPHGSWRCSVASVTAYRSRQN
jgi:excisionase family DNA binding protein